MKVARARRPGAAIVGLRVLFGFPVAIEPREPPALVAVDAGEPGAQLKHAEVTATAYDDMVAEGRKLADLADNVCVKVPLTMPGLKACRTLSQAGAKVIFQIEPDERIEEETPAQVQERRARVTSSLLH